MKKRVSVEAGPQASASYSQAIITSGPTLYVAGNGPVDPETSKVISDRFEEQCSRCLENLKTLIEAAGATMADVVKVNAYLADLGNFQKFDEIYQRYFPEPFPARTTIGCQLGGGYLIEVDCIVALEE